MQIIPKACRAGLVIALLVVVLVLGMLPGMTHMSAIPIQPTPARAILSDASADARAIEGLWR